MNTMYDRALTVFAPDGRLLQVEYAQEAVRQASPAVGVKGKDVVILAVEKKSVPQLQLDRTVRKLVILDDHIAMTFAGLSADARVLINRARIECQSHRLVIEEPANVGYIAKFLSDLKLKYTQKNGMRPFGVACLIGGFDRDGTPRLYHTEPSGAALEWRACCTGRRVEVVKKSLEQNYRNEDSEEKLLTTAIKALMEALSAGHHSIQVAILRRGDSFTFMNSCDVSNYVDQVEFERSIEI